MVTIQLKEEQQELLKTLSRIVYTTDEEYYNIPVWFKRKKHTIDEYEILEYLNIKREKEALMTLHIDQSVNIIEQLDHLSAFLATKRINVVVSEDQIKEVEKAIYGKYLEKEIPTTHLVVLKGDCQFSLYVPEIVDGVRVYIPTSLTKHLPDAASSEGHTDK